MALVLEGFDSLTNEAPLSQQLPGFVLHGEESISLVTGRNNQGKAIKLTNDAYLEYQFHNESSHKRTISAGAAFKYANKAANNILMYVCNSDVPSISTDHETNGLSHHNTGVAVLYVKDGFLWMERRSNVRSKLAALPENQYVYVEVRFAWEYRPSYYAPTSYVYMNGQQLAAMPKLDFGSGTKYVSVYIGRAPQGMTIEVDDLYIEEYTSAINSNIPILASGKISDLALAVESNTFAVTGESVESALSDASDATYISSNDPAEVVFNVSRNIPQIYGIQMAARGKSETSGVTSFSLVDSSGNNIIAEQNVGFPASLTSYSLSASIASSDTNNKIKAGAKFKVRT
ncbi:hypothetical protein VP758_001587 [Vibrio harveyi]|nr:hypothetical protein [Vibrio harveyi]